MTLARFVVWNITFSLICLGFAAAVEVPLILRQRAYMVRQCEKWGYELWGYEFFEAFVIARVDRQSISDRITRSFCIVGCVYAVCWFFAQLVFHQVQDILMWSHNTKLAVVSLTSLAGPIWWARTQFRQTTFSLQP